MYEQISRSVIERYADQALEPIERERLISEATEQLCTVAGNVATQARAQVLADWRESHRGQDPDYSTTVGLYNNATQMGVEVALAQLWEGYQDPADQASDTEPDASWWARQPAMVRWRTEWAVAATPEIEQLSETVWPTQTPRFQVVAEDLLAALAHDKLPLPSGPDDPAVSGLTTLVLAQLDQLDAVSAHQS